MDLKDTIEMMNSEDFKDRFIAEYNQLCIRRNKLALMIGQYMRGVLSFEPKTPIDILMSQCAIMNAYIEILKTRARIEGVDLPIIHKEDVNK